MRVNDIWRIIHDPAQEWYVTSDMDSRTGYVFETLSTPHGAVTLPGEDTAAALYGQLEAAATAVRKGDRVALAQALALLPDASGKEDERMTAPLQRCVDDVRALVAECVTCSELLLRG